MLEMPTRRGLLTGLVAFIAAPAIVRASSLMPISSRYLMAGPPEIIASNWTLAYRCIIDRDPAGLEHFIIERISAEEMWAR